MTDASPPQPPRNRLLFKVFHAIRRRWAILAAGISIAIGIAFLPPIGLEWGVIKALTQLGMSRVVIGDSDLKLFGGTVILQGVEAQGNLSPSEKSPAIRLGGLNLRFLWRPLFQRTLSLAHVSLDGLAVDIWRTPDGTFVINGLNLPTTSKSEGRVPWALSLDDFHINQGHVTYTDQSLKITLAIDDFTIDGLHTAEPDRPIHLALNAHLNGHPITIMGEMTPLAAHPHVALHITADALDLNLATAIMHQPEIKGQTTFDVDVTTDINPDQDWETMATVNGTASARSLAFTNGTSLEQISAQDLGLSWNGKDKTLLAKAVVHTGKVTAQGISWGQGALVIKQAKIDLGAKRYDGAGSVDLSKLTVKSEDADATVDTLTVTAQSLTFGDGHFGWQGSVKTATPLITQAPSTFEPKNLAWSGTVGGTMKQGAVRTIDIKGHLEGDAFKLTQPHLMVSNGPFKTDGDFSVGFGTTLSVKGQANGVVQAVRVTDGAKQEFANLGQAAVSDFHLGPDGAMTVSNLHLSDAKALQQRGKDGFAWRMEAGQIRINRATRSRTGAVSLDQVDLNGILARLTLDDDGKMIGIPRDQSKPPAQAQAQAQAQAETSPPIHVAVERLTLDGANRIEFEDRSLDDPMHLTINGIHAALSNLDSADPQRDSPFTLSGMIGSSSLTASGALRPLADPFGANAVLSVHALELPQFSPYAQDYIGLDLQTGHFDGEAKMGLKQGQLTGHVDMTISNLNVTEPDGPTDLAKHAGMPIQTVLGLLQDDQGNIHLGIPISGNLTDPQFDVSDAISQAVGGALKSTAQTTLKVLFPVAALIDVLSDDDGAVSLDPLRFQPGDSHLDSAQEKRVETLGALLKARPQLTLRLCGVASVKQDWPVLLDTKRHEELGMFYGLEKALNLAPKAGTGNTGGQDSGGAEAQNGVPPDRDALKALAARRAAQVKSGLMESHSITAARLYDCLPAIDESANGIPRVELGF